MIELNIVRDTFLKDRTLGVMYIKGHEYQTGERIWASNQRNISCIPTGRYRCMVHQSPRFGKCIKILDVPGRDNILIHTMNFPATQSQGCIGVGCSRMDIDGDNIKDLYQSRVALNEILSLIGHEKEIFLTIENKECKNV